MIENIVVTGFGPFEGHPVNASWEAVKKLPEDILGYQIIKKEIPVIYDQVENKVPDLWKTYNPKLVVHVGVSAYTNNIQIETCANRCGYCRKDCSGGTRLTGPITCVGDVCLKTGLDVDSICEQINQQKLYKLSTSCDAGRFLCEYIYYTSLNIDKNKALFVHVPQINKPYSVDELAAVLLEIVKCALEQDANNSHVNMVYKNGRAAAVY